VFSAFLECSQMPVSAGFYYVEFVSLPGSLYKQLQDDTESLDYVTKLFLQPW